MILMLAHWVNSHAWQRKKLGKLYNKLMDKAIEHELKTSEEVVKKEVMAALLLSGADKLRYGGLNSTLAQYLSMGMNQYPCTVDETLNILNAYHKTTKGNSWMKTPIKLKKNQTEVIFAQANTTKKSEHSKPDITCYHCD